MPRTLRSATTITNNAESNPSQFGNLEEINVQATNIHFFHHHHEISSTPPAPAPPSETTSNHGSYSHVNSETSPRPPIDVNKYHYKTIKPPTKPPTTMRTSSQHQSPTPKYSYFNKQTAPVTTPTPVRNPSATG